MFFKGQLLAAVIFFANCNSGLEGMLVFDELLYALYNVICTSFVILTFLWLDQDVPYELAEEEEDEGWDNLLDTNYNPNTWHKSYRKKGLVSGGWLFRRSDLLETKGITRRADGSTDVLPQYFWYLKESVFKGKFTRFDFMIGSVWACLAGAFSYYTTAYTLSNALYYDGTTLDFWAIGYVTVLVNVFVIFVMVSLETYNWQWVNTSLFLLSFLLFMPISLLLVNSIGSEESRG